MSAAKYFLLLSFEEFGALAQEYADSLAFGPNLNKPLEELQFLALPHRVPGDCHMAQTQNRDFGSSPKLFSALLCAKKLLPTKRELFLHNVARCFLIQDGLILFCRELRLYGYIHTQDDKMQQYCWDSYKRACNCCVHNEEIM